MKLASEINGASATVMYDEDDIRRRNMIAEALRAAINKALNNLNPAIRMIQVETPTLLPSSALQGHRDVGFELCDVPMHDQTLTLRPETTLGTLAMLPILYPQKEQLKKRLPICLWQVGKVYRNEQIRPLGELRFREFYQIEFQLIASLGSQADYFQALLDGSGWAIRNIVQSSQSLCEEAVSPDNLAHYSLKTTDIFAGSVEIGAISQRTDLHRKDLLLYEASFGLDRLTYLCEW